jgi:hypothetical protein
VFLVYNLFSPTRTLRVVVYAHPEGGVEVTGELMPFGASGPDSSTDDPPELSHVNAARSVGTTIFENTPAAGSRAGRRDFREN